MHGSVHVALVCIACDVGQTLFALVASQSAQGRWKGQKRPWHTMRAFTLRSCAVFVEQKLGLETETWNTD